MSNNVLDLPNYINFFFNLFALVNPIGILPIFISMTNNQNIHNRNQINLITNCSVAIILFFSLILGEVLLKLFNISIDSLRIAGGILIIIIAIPMIIKKINTKKEKTIFSNQKNIAIVPLALPLMAGPGAISSCIIWSSHWNGYKNLIGLSLICIIFSFFCWFLFKTANFLIKIFGETGINIITKITGLLLMSIGVEFIIIGIKTVFQH